MRPLAVTPQIKKQPARIQNVEVLKTSDSAESDIGRISPRAKRAGRFCALVPLPDRYGSRPTSAGLSRIQNQIAGISRAAVAVIIVNALRQPLARMTDINNG